MDGAKREPVALFRSLDEINFLVIAIVVVGAWLLILASERALPWLAARVPSRLRLHILRLVPVLRLAILIVAAVQIVPQIITPTPENLLATVGAAGLAIGFAFKDYVSSLIGGIITIYERPYRQGDWITVGGTYGEVRSIGLRAFTVLTPDDDLVTVPHATMWNEQIHNSNDGQRTHLCATDFYLHPRHDGRAVQRKLHEVALTSCYLDLERPVAVAVAEKPWGTHYRIKAYPVDSRQQFAFVSDLTVRGKAALTRLGVEPALRPVAGAD